MTDSPRPHTGGQPEQTERNAEIIRRYREGEDMPTLADAFGITKARVWQIIQRARGKREMRELDEIKCDRCKQAGGTKELHVCPYQSEIYDIDEPICNCCEDCTDECAGDI